MDIFFLAGSNGLEVKAAEPLLVGESRLKLTFNQWHWLHDEWSTSDVRSLDGSS
jgi:hypothetical protein